MITVDSRPDFFTAVYRPIEYTFTSDLSPNTTATENGTYVAVLIADSTLVLACTSLKIGQVVILNDTAPSDVTWQFPGNKVEIPNGVYAGSHTILNKIACGASFIIVIDAEPNGDDNSGDDYARHYPNFNVVVKINNEDSPKLIETVRLKRDSSDDFIANVAPFLKQEVSSFLETKKFAAFLSQNEQRVNFAVEYAEEYDDIQSDGTVDRFQSSFTDDAGTFDGLAVNSVQPLFYKLDKDEIILKDMSKFEIDLTSDVDSNWLTAVPSEVRVTLDQTFQVSLLYNGATNDLRIFIKGFDSTGSLVTSVDVNTDTGTQFTIKDLYFFGVAPVSNWMTDTTIAYFELSIVDEATLLIPAIRPIRFVIDRRCYSNQRTFYFQGEHSNMDSYNFIGKETATQRTVKSFKESQLSSGYDLSVRTGGGGSTFETERSVTFSDSLKSFTTSSGRVNQATAEWLATMVKSSNVFTEFEDTASSAYIPVNIEAGSVNIYNSKDNLFEVSFKWSYSYKDLSQNG